MSKAHLGPGPGSVDWAIILGAMILHGLTPGPNMMREQPDVIWVAVLVILAAGGHRA